MDFWKKNFHFPGPTCNRFRLSCRVVRERNEGKCKGERGKAQGREGSERGSKQRQRLDPLSLSLPPSVFLARSLTVHSVQWAASPGTGLSPMWGEMHRWYGSRPVPRGKVMRWGLVTGWWHSYCCMHFSAFILVLLLFSLWAKHRDEFVWMRYD